jgi:hypothetical protein
MPKPLTLSIPHTLGRAEAKRRLTDGLTEARARLAAVATSIEDRWVDDRLEFRLVALAQTVTGRIEVLEESVWLEVELPWALGMLAERIRTKVIRQGTLLLDRKPPA